MVRWTGGGALHGWQPLLQHVPCVWARQRVKAPPAGGNCKALCCMYVQGPQQLQLRASAFSCQVTCTCTMQLYMFGSKITHTAHLSWLPCLPWRRLLTPTSSVAVPAAANTAAVAALHSLERLRLPGGAASKRLACLTRSSSSCIKAPAAAPAATTCRSMQRQP